ncbi:MAG: ABC transporter permease [Flavobacteriaceae bacterium]|nr:ABC transporter permease [Flavobacteriaceae bacterium]
MYKLWIATYKEFLLLKRDLGGLVVLFLMPLVLLITVTLIQNSSFANVDSIKIPIILIDNDVDELSKSIISNLKGTNTFEIFSEIDGKPIDENQANDLVLKGKYQMAIIIPKNLTANLMAKVSQNVDRILSEMGMDENSLINQPNIKPQQIKLYFDPASHLSFKNGVKNSIDKMVSKIESQTIYSTFQNELEIEGELFDNSSFISFYEINTHQKNTEIKPNSVQHNVPAWALFAIFFIIIPLSINMVKEKNQGTFIRLKTSPISYLTTIGGKVLVYLSICMLQFLLMLLVGFYIFPHLNLPEFTINGSYFLLLIVAIFSGLAAIGFGILLGTVSTTTEQSAPFGATSVVLLAAIGGVWIPIFAMPKFMQILAKISPMNWGLNGFYDVIIRNGSFIDILPEISLLGLFFIIMVIISIYYDKVKNTV